MKRHEKKLKTKVYLSEHNKSRVLYMYNSSPLPRKDYFCVNLANLAGDINGSGASYESHRAKPESGPRLEGLYVKAQVLY